MVLRVSSEVLAALDRGATIVTPHERAARTVRLAWDLEHRSRGMRSWPTAPALSWQAWTASLWHDLLLDGRVDAALLKPVQERRLWSTVLLQQATSLPHSAVEALVTACMETHRRLEAYARSRTWAEGDPSLSAELFPRSLRQLNARCREARLLPAAELDDVLATTLARDPRSPQSDNVVLFGFDEFSPAQQRLLAVIRRTGLATVQVPSPSYPGARFVHAAETPEAEIRAFARWARARLHDAPEVRLALLVPSLREQRDEIEAVLRETLAPEFATLFPTENRSIFEISLGRPLSTEPLLQTACDLLRWTRQSLPVARISRLLLSSHVGRANPDRTPEMDARAAFDQIMRRELRLRPEISLAETLATLSQLPSADLRGALSGLEQDLRALLLCDLARDARSDSRPRRASAWIASLRDALARAGWGDSLTSFGFQLRERWEVLLDELAGLDLFGTELSFHDLFAALEQQARLTVFAPESHEAPIQVLGPGEAAGQAFDAVWVLRCGSLEWPPETPPSSLLPLWLQRDLGLPGGDRNRDRERATQLTARLASCAPEVVFSYAVHTADAGQQTLASVMQALHPSLLPCDPSLDPHSAQEPLPLEQLIEEDPIAPLPSPVVAGGARLLQLQAACGFHAFAELRLNAHALESQSLGLDARERGNTVHQALDALWGQLQSQGQLRHLSPDELNARLDDAIAFGLRKAISRSSSTWDAAYLEVQQTRLRRLLAEWLQHESARPDFEVIHRELRLDQVPVGPLQLSVRIDRIDRVAGSHVLLDYKTSKFSHAAWNGERPEQPQLLLYALLVAAGHLPHSADEAAPQVNALAFANLVAGPSMSLNGAQREGAAALSPTKGTRSIDLDQALPEWSRILTRLATDFANGEARVNPLQFPRTCDFCDQRLLCRVAPETLSILQSAGEDHELDDE